MNVDRIMSRLIGPLLITATLIGLYMAGMEPIV